MRSAIVRLALFQIVAVFYSILIVGLILKIRFDGAAPHIFAAHLRDYGILLLILPGAWVVWASVSAHRPRAHTGELNPILTSGVLLLAVLFFIAAAGTISAIVTRPLYHGTTPLAEVSS